MKIVLTILASVFAVALYVAWLNGLFLRCPHCRKVGSWRYDTAEPPVTERDEDGVVRKSTEVRICRKCRGRVLDKWSDEAGCTFEKPT